MRSQSFDLFAFKMFLVLMTMGKHNPNNTNGVYEDALIKLEL
jgi:hypothetical protein